MRIATEPFIVGQHSAVEGSAALIRGRLVFLQMHQIAQGLYRIRRLTAPAWKPPISGVTTERIPPSRPDGDIANAEAEDWSQRTGDYIAQRVNVCPAR